ncbi:MAG: TIGR03862 family flavoprotein, partial [Burkholderiales bacterium]
PGTVGWSAHFAQRFEGAPLKSVALRFDDGQGAAFERQGECVITRSGIEGSLVYAVSGRLRDAIVRDGAATLHLDLLAGRTVQQIAEALSRPRGRHSLSEHLRRTISLQGVKAALIREVWNNERLSTSVASNPRSVALALKSWPLRVVAPRPMAEAISTAGGVRLDAMNEHLMLRARPGVFCAGEMLDWEAPTGGYLLTACLASGALAADGVLTYLRNASMPQSVMQHTQN